MQGFVSLSSKSGAQYMVLPQEDCYLAINEEIIIHHDLPRHENDVIRVRWLEAQSSWLISKQGLNEKRHSFIDQLVIEINGISVFFRKQYNRPKLADGSEFDNLKLHPQSFYVFGTKSSGMPPINLDSANNSSADKECLVLLDPQSTGIDDQHTTLSKRGSNWYITDISQRGTTLNGNAFRTAKLIYGDRFTIDTYLFEFRTDEIRRVDHLNFGNINAQNLSVDVIDYKTHKPKRILNEVSVTIHTGEFIGILGGSGQGKSTLMNALCGMRKADDGSVFIGGISVAKLSNEYPGVIGYVPQDDIVHRELTVLQAMDYSARLKLKLKKQERADLIEKTIQRLGLDPHKEKKISVLSGGQRKRLSIAIELLSKPSVLFLDEPSSGLDPSTEASLMELLQSLTKDRLTVVCTTHVLQKAYLFDRLMFIHDGRLVFDGNAQEAREHFLESSVSGTTETKLGFAQTPLEKIYDIILADDFNAKQWEVKFQSTKKKSDQVSVNHAEAEQQLKNLGGNRVSAVSKLWTLLSRQHAILRSDWLNVLFLMAQVVMIGLIIAWVSNDFTFRLFLGMIASIWFGCSNGAQQIVSEFPVFKREKVCGLGLAPYALSKCFYVGAVSVLQAVLLLFIVTVVGHFFHPYSFEEESFELGISKRMEENVRLNSPVATDTSQLTEEDGFIDVVDENTPKEEAGKTYITESESPVSSMPALGLSSNPDDFSFLGMNWRKLLVVGNMFHCANNITDSASMALIDTNGDQLLYPDGRPQFSESIPVREIIAVTISLKLFSFALAALTGVGLGLAISALVRTPTQAVMWVPLLLIPQILFGGYVITVPEMPKLVRKVAELVPSYCCQRILDNSNLYSRKMPDLSNTTKTPIFLTTNGEKEIVTWNNGVEDREEKFDKESDVNVSWQNLLIDAELLGQHKIVKEKVGSTRLVNLQIVSERADVTGKPRELFLDTIFSKLAFYRLSICSALCFITILAALKWKTK